MRQLAHRAWERAMADNMRNIAILAGKADSLLDLGCDAGGRTTWLAEQTGAREVHGIEISEDRAAIAAEKGIQVHVGDLNTAFPYPDQSFDLVVSNQVIEHVADTDRFVSETPGFSNRTGAP
jgi:ubiquinone/menaquinone biosynthesis C-methylase UbiE